MPSKKLSAWLCLLLVAFIIRVVGQALVAFFDVAWLPPMQEWMSGLMPYPYLLPSQIVIVVMLTKICWDFSRARGYFVKPNRFIAKYVLAFGYVYFTGMVLRYVLRMWWMPEARWFGGTIPIFFHFVLASFSITIGRWHKARIQELS